MARAVQELWPDAKVTIGPVIENGWYYDFDRAEPFTPEDLETITGAHAADHRRPRPGPRPRSGTATARSATTRRWASPTRSSWSRRSPAADPVRMYWHGPWQDLCRGPHLANTGQVPADAFKLMSIAGAYWRGDSRRPMLQRIYGVAFRTRADLDAYLHQLEEAQKRDHRRLGQGDGPLPPAAGGAGVDLLASERVHALAGARGLHPPPARRRRLCRGEDAAAPRLGPLGAVGALGQVPREHVRGARRDPRRPTRTRRCSRARPSSWR